MEECISFGAYKTIQRHSREAETPSIDGARVDWMFDPLFQASQLTLIRHINNIINQLPVPHQILCLNDQSSENNQYIEKMEDLLTDHSCVEEIFQLTAALVQYLTGLARFPWKPAMPKESQSDVCRFCTLAMEVSHYVFFALYTVKIKICTPKIIAVLILKWNSLVFQGIQKVQMEWQTV